MAPPSLSHPLQISSATPALQASAAVWQSKRVLLTGAGGFIGSHLTERLVRAGAKVRALVHYNSRNDWGLLELLSTEIKEQLDVFLGDLTDATLIRKAVADCQLVFHLGALIAIPYSYQAPRQFIDTNVIGTLNVLQACLDAKISKLIHTSTSETYGSALYTPIDERHPLQAQSPYAASKIAADKLVESFSCSFELPVAILRPFNTFGPRQSARAVIPTIISQALTGDTVHLGSLTPVRDFTFVEDTVTAFMKVAESPESVGQVFNAGTGQGVTIGEIAHKIIEICGGQKTVVVDQQRFRPARSEVTALICNSTKAKASLGWTPQFTLDQGLQRTVDYICHNMNRYKTKMFTI
jgi:NAD dependent epimerase/dehydratase